MLATVYPAVSPLLPAAIATLCLMHQASGQAALFSTAATAAAAGNPSATGTAEAGSATFPEGSAPWQVQAAAALVSAGLRAGDMALHLGRHFSVRDLFKWCKRMQVSSAGLWLLSRRLTSCCAGIYFCLLESSIPS